MEWGLAITITNQDEPKEDWIRRIDFESKEVTVSPIHFVIKDGPGYTTLESTQPQMPVSRPTVTDRKVRSANGYAN
jgi:hypothetical protein